MDGEGLPWSTIIQRLNPTLFTRPMESMHEYDKSGQTVLFAATFLGREDWVRYLIKYGCDVNQKTRPSNLSPLIVALQDISRPDIVKMLLEAKADTNAVCRDGSTPLRCALTYWNNLETINLLLKYGADVNFNNPLDVTVTHYDSKEISMKLILAGARCSAKFKDLRHPDIIRFITCLANCKIATRCVERVIIKRYGKVHKDIIPSIVSFVWESKEDIKWDL